MPTILTMVAALASIPISHLPAMANDRPSIIEPRMRLPPALSGPRVALTFDACSGAVDERILAFLKSQAPAGA